MLEALMRADGAVVTPSLLEAAWDARRPVHEHGPDDGDEAAPQARRAGGDRHRPRRRLPLVSIRAPRSPTSARWWRARRPVLGVSWWALQRHFSRTLPVPYAGAVLGQVAGQYAIAWPAARCSPWASAGRRPAMRWLRCARSRAHGRANLRSSASTPAWAWRSATSCASSPTTFDAMLDRIAVHRRRPEALRRQREPRAAHAADRHPHGGRAGHGSSVDPGLADDAGARPAVLVLGSPAVIATADDAQTTNARSPASKPWRGVGRGVLDGRTVTGRV